MVPSPKDHPNAYAGFSTAAVAAFLVTELHTRLGVDITMAEASYAVAATVALVLFLGRRRRKA